MSTPFTFDQGEIDFKLMLPKSPKHIAMIKICPKRRKHGDYVIIHFQLKKLDVPAETDEQMNIDSQLLIQNIIETEVKPLLKQMLASIPEISKDCLDRHIF